jgi:hypothetical protein
MKPFISLLLLLGAVWAPVTSFGQEVAGRVLVAVGDVTIVRGAQRIAAKLGTEVRSGDTFELGAQSNAQIGLTDESIIALRPDTRFQIADYSFAGQRPETESAFFRLFVGGMRTVTGLIGKKNTERYRVSTAIATVGIRGTHYSLVECVSSCRDGNGTLVADGTYGAVTDGRIAVTNQTGETQFGADQYFYVAGINVPPLQLIAPPSFLRDTLEGRARAQKQQQQQAQISKPAGASAEGKESAGAVAQTGEGVSTTVAGNSAVPLALATNVFQSTQDFGTQGPAAVLQQTSTGTVFFRLDSSTLNIPISCSSPPCGTIVAGEFTLGVNFALQRATASAAIRLNDGGVLNASIPISISGIPITVSGNQVTFSGTFNSADFPFNSGSFRCSDCGLNNTPGLVGQVTFSGTISGSAATITVSGAQGTDTFSFTANLAQTPPPNNSAAAIATQRLAGPGANGGGGDARSAAYFNVQVDASGRLLQFGARVGGIAASVGTATNTIVGAAPTAGNLVWGTWTGGGSTITDFNYNTFTTTSSQTQPWITGDATNSLPQSLGTLTFTPVGSAFRSTNVETLNSASLTADFVNRSLSLSLNATRVDAGNTYQMNGTTGFSPTSGRFSSRFDTVTCTGPCNNGVGTPGGSFGGFFAGPQAQGAGVAFSVGFGTVSSVSGFGINGVVAFGRQSPP